MNLINRTYYHTFTFLKVTIISINCNNKLVKSPKCNEVNSHGCFVVFVMKFDVDVDVDVGEYNYWFYPHFLLARCLRRFVIKICWNFFEKLLCISVWYGIAFRWIGVTVFLFILHYETILFIITFVTCTFAAYQILQNPK